MTKSGAPRSRSGRLPPVIVATWVRPFSPNTWKAEVPSVCTCAPGARCASRNAAASSLEKPLTTAMATDPMRPLGWRSHYLGSFFVSADMAYVLPFRNEVRILLKFLKTWPKTAKAVLGGGDDAGLAGGAAALVALAAE